MEREIKFRAKRLDNKRWVYGLPYFNYSEGVFSITCSNGWTPTYNNPDEGEYTLFIPVDPETLTEFTGLKDKNGKEIYECDIIESDNPNYGYGNTDEPDCLYTTIESIIDFYDDEYLRRKCESGEVIGNIYENPELIK